MAAESSSRKRKKVSGLTGLELRAAHDWLKKLKQSLIVVNDNEAFDGSQVPAITIETEFEGALDAMITMMESKLNGPHALSFSGITYQHLEALNILQRGSLQLKNDESRIRAIEDVGNTAHWSSRGLYEHLCLLQGLVPQVNEAAARIWTNAFFYRATAMLPPEERMVLSVEQGVPATAVNPQSFTTLGGYIDYTALMASPDHARNFLNFPTLAKLDGHHRTLFVSEAKVAEGLLEAHIPQAVCEMYACAKRIGKDVIRGALTNGKFWIFLFLRMNADGNGATYAESNKLTLWTAVNAEPVISRYSCDLIAGVIAYWIEHSNEDIDDRDWFNIRWRTE